MKEYQIGTKTYVLHKMSAWDQLGLVELLEITDMAGTFKSLNKRENLVKVLEHVSVKHDDGGLLALKTPDLINNHCAGAKEALVLAGMALDYNFDFFGKGGGLSFSDFLQQKIEQLVIPTVTQLLEQFLVLVNQQSQNSSKLPSKKR